jgi:hypothetical protein
MGFSPEKENGAFVEIKLAVATFRKLKIFRNRFLEEKNSSQIYP